MQSINNESVFHKVSSYREENEENFLELLRFLFPFDVPVFIKENVKKENNGKMFFEKDGHYRKIHFFFNTDTGKLKVKFFFHELPDDFPIEQSPVIELEQAVKFKNLSYQQKEGLKQMVDCYLKTGSLIFFKVTEPEKETI